MMFGHVIQLGEVLLYLVELHAAAVWVHEKFPISLADGEHGTVMKGLADDAETPFPKQRRGTRAGAAKEHVAHGFAVEFVAGGDADAGKFANAWQPIHARDHRGVVNFSG